MISQGNLNNERRAHLHQNIISIWDAYFLPADTNNDGSVEYLELLDHMKAVSKYKGNNQFNFSYIHFCVCVCL